VINQSGSGGKRRFVMYDFLVSERESALKAEARRFVKDDVPGSLTRRMDADQVRYPREFIKDGSGPCLMIACRSWEV
jgi:hypothetical protein